MKFPSNLKVQVSVPLKGKVYGEVHGYLQNYRLSKWEDAPS